MQRPRATPQQLAAALGASMPEFHARRMGAPQMATPAAPNLAGMMQELQRRQASQQGVMTGPNPEIMPPIMGAF